MIAIGNEKIRESKVKTNKILRWTQKIVYDVKSGDSGRDLGGEKICTFIYFHEIHLDSKNLRWLVRDCVVLIKGHTSTDVHASLIFDMVKALSEEFFDRFNFWPY